MPTAPASGVPEGYHAVTPYLLVPGVDAVIAFVERTFESQRMLRLVRPDGSVMHAEMRIGGSPVMLGEPGDDFGSTPGHVFVYVEDCGAAYARGSRRAGRA